MISHPEQQKTLKLVSALGADDRDLIRGIIELCVSDPEQAYEVIEGMKDSMSPSFREALSASFQLTEERSWAILVSSVGEASCVSIPLTNATLRLSRLHQGVNEFMPMVAGGISDISPCVNWRPEVSVFDISRSQVSDLSPISSFRKLRVLGIPSRSIPTLSSLELPDLTQITIMGDGNPNNPGPDLHSLRRFPRLNQVHLRHFAQANVKPLVNMPGVMSITLSRTTRLHPHPSEFMSMEMGPIRVLRR